MINNKIICILYFLSFCNFNIKAQLQAPCSEKKRSFQLNVKKITPLTDTSYFDQIPGLKSKKIVAIGETIHGTETMNEIAFQLIKYQVEKNNCRLVLLEVSLEKMLSFNRLVQGDESFNIDSLLNHFNMDFISFKQLKEFCVWLKNYNKTTKERVWFLGADYCISSVECIYLCDYLYTINQTKQHSSIKELYKNIYDALFTGDYSNTFKTLSESYTVLEGVIGKTETAIIKHCITTLDQVLKATDKDGIKAQLARDSIMFVNTEFLINLLNPEKTTIFQHWLHVNYKMGGYPVAKLKPFGAYLKEKFKENVFSTSICSQSGSYLTYDRDSLTGQPFMMVQKLEEPPVGSLEYYLSKANDDYFYVPVSEFPMSSINTRIVGNRNTIQQFTNIPINSTDGIIFIRKCDPLYYPTEKLYKPVHTKTTNMLIKHNNTWQIP